MDQGKIIQQLLACFADKKLKRAIKYVAEKETIKLTRQHKHFRGNPAQDTFLLTLGPPNYNEREFIAKCKKVGEPFPVKKIQLAFYPKKK